MNRPRTAGWTAVAVAEVLLATAAVVFDVFLPTLVILAIAGISLAIRRQGPATLGFRGVPRPWHLAGMVFALSIGWTLVQVGVTMPILTRLTGQRQDFGPFADLQGNLPALLLFLALSWTLAAVGEETAYRGFLERRVSDVVGSSRVGTVLAVGVSATLFGLAHTEQGVIGVILTALDAVFFSILKRRFRTLWAAVLAHGFNNTIGIVAFYLVGPIHGLW